MMTNERDAIFDEALEAQFAMQEDLPVNYGRNDNEPKRDWATFVDNPYSDFEYRTRAWEALADDEGTLPAETCEVEAFQGEVVKIHDYASMRMENNKCSGCGLRWDFCMCDPSDSAWHPQGYMPTPTTQGGKDAQVTLMWRMANV